MRPQKDPYSAHAVLSRPGEGFQANSFSPASLLFGFAVFQSAFSQTLSLQAMAGDSTREASACSKKTVSLLNCLIVNEWHTGRGNSYSNKQCIMKTK
jgi:hypothetical protein